MENDPKRKQLFENCVAQCADSIYRVAFRLTGNQTLASELVQETYLNAWQSIGKLKSEDRMRAWMFSILRNQYTKLLRVEKKAVNVTGELSDISQPSEDQSSVSDRVNQALSKLKEPQKMVVLLVSMEGFPVNEAAQMLDLPKGTVLSRLHRARETLKRILESDLQLRVESQKR